MKKMWGFEVYGWMEIFTSKLWIKIIHFDEK
jgi:hypothetical protein